MEACPSIPPCQNAYKCCSKTWEATIGPCKLTSWASPPASRPVWKKINLGVSKEIGFPFRKQRWYTVREEPKASRKHIQFPQDFTYLTNFINNAEKVYIIWKPVFHLIRIPLSIQTKNSSSRMRKSTLLHTSWTLNNGTV